MPPDNINQMREEIKTLRKENADLRKENADLRHDRALMGDNLCAMRDERDELCSQLYSVSMDYSSACITIQEAEEVIRGYLHDLRAAENLIRELQSAC